MIWQEGGGTRRPSYICQYFPRCDMMVYAERDGTPWGSVSDAQTRAARIRAHHAFDPLWRGPARCMTRVEAYDWLASVMQLSPDVCHIRFMNLEQCERVVVLCSERILEQYGAAKPENPKDLTHVHEALLDAFDPAMLQAFDIAPRERN